MYQHIYAALYGWNLERWHGDDYMASFLTACALSGAVGMNGVLGIGLYVAVYGPLEPVPVIGDSIFLIGGGALLLLHYLAFVRQERYKDLLQRFRTKAHAEQQRVKTLAWTYLGASYGLPAGFFFLMAVLSNP
jgi:hypothetical protein